MYLKPCWKPQKKAQALDTNKETQNSHEPPGSYKMTKNCKTSYMKSSVFPTASPGQVLPRKPFGVLSPNVLCSVSGRGPADSSFSVKAKKNGPSATGHQGGKGEGPLDTWAVVKQGNTKEKIAFFAAHQCSNRIGSTQTKSPQDIDGRATKRGKKSGDLKEAMIQLERMKEVNSRRREPEPLVRGIERHSVHCGSDSGEGVCAQRPLSVTQMVAFLEKRASAAPLASGAKHCTNPPATLRVSGQFRGVFPASELFSAPGVCEELPEQGNPEVGEHQSKPVRVLDMVARLESECLKRKSQPEPGSLSRNWNSSFRQKESRMFFADAIQGDGGEINKGTLEAPGTQVNPVGSVSVNCGPPRADHCSLKGKQAWAGGPRGCPSVPAGMKIHMDPAVLEPDPQSAIKSTNRYDVEITEEAESPVSSQTCPQAVELPKDDVACVSEELVPQNPDQRRKEYVSTTITVPKVKRDQPRSLKSCDNSLPRGLFSNLPPGRRQLDYSQLKESTTEKSSEASQLEDPAEGGSASEKKGASACSFVPTPASPVAGTVPVAKASSWKKQVSHDFLETRFKIQQLLEPKQYMAILPHHVMVKIFGLLPTKTLVALKCTCSHFKFIIERYDIRPADSRWIRDPRYRGDPCKQCKKKCVKGDVSLCRWHPKPYCQTSPSGSGYWMCCYRAQDFPGCQLGLHDNHWVPAGHSSN